MVKEISIIEAKTAINDSKNIILDVRTKEEINSVPFPDECICIPLGELESRINELPKDKIILTLCHHGHRSIVAAQILEKYKISSKSIKGGIHAWAEFDTNIKKYLRSPFGIVFEK